MSKHTQRRRNRAKQSECGRADQDLTTLEVAPELESENDKQLRVSRRKTKILFIVNVRLICTFTTQESKLNTVQSRSNVFDITTNSS